MKIAASMSVGRLAPKHSLNIDNIRVISKNVTPKLIRDDVVILDRLRGQKGELAYEAVLQYGTHEDIGGAYYADTTSQERKAELHAEFESVYHEWVESIWGEGNVLTQTAAGLL